MVAGLGARHYHLSEARQNYNSTAADADMTIARQMHHDAVAVAPPSLVLPDAVAVHVRPLRHRALRLALSSASFVFLCKRNRACVWASARAGTPRCSTKAPCKSTNGT